MAEATIVAARDNNDETTSEISSYSQAASQQGQGHGEKKRSKYKALEKKLNDTWGKKFTDLDTKLDSILSRLGSPAAHGTGNVGSEVDHEVARNSSDQEIDRSGRRDAEVDYDNIDTLSLLIDRAEGGSLVDDEDDDIDKQSESARSRISMSSSEGRFKGCRLSADDKRDALYIMFGNDALPSTVSESKTGLVPDKTQEQIIQQSWRSEEPSKLSAYKADTYNSFKLDKGFENLLAVPSLDSIVDPLLKHRYGKKASFKNGHSLYGTTYKSIEKEAYKGQCASRMAMIITMYIQQGLGKLLKVLQEKDVNIDMAVQSTKDIFAMASQNLDQCSRAGAYHHLVRRKATIADTGLDRRISDFERWELPLTHEGIFGKELENKMKLRKEENKSVQDLFSDDEKPNANKGFQNKRKSNFEQSSNSNYKRTRFESPKRRYNDKSDSGFRGRSQYRGGYSSRGQSSSRQGSSFRGGRRGNKQ